MLPKPGRHGPLVHVTYDSGERESRLALKHVKRLYTSAQHDQARRAPKPKPSSKRALDVAGLAADWRSGKDVYEKATYRPREHRGREVI